MEAVKEKCELCGKDFDGDGYQWVCADCSVISKDCPCGSDDVRLDWHIEIDQNGVVIPDPVWRVECASCDKQTTNFLTAKEAFDAWMNDEVFTPIGNTGHFEEAW